MIQEKNGRKLKLKFWGLILAPFLFACSTVQFHIPESHELWLNSDFTIVEQDLKNKRVILRYQFDTFSIKGYKHLTKLNALCTLYKVECFISTDNAVNLKVTLYGRSIDIWKTLNEWLGL